MPQHPDLSPPPRVRRSHAERAAETRRRIIAAVGESIDEVGFQRTTAAEIARRAGVTWGAVQHHFGDKQGILVAVLEDSTNRFVDHLAAVPLEGLTLEERVSAFVERAWEHFSSRHYRCTFEILLNWSASEASLPELAGSLAELQGPSWVEIWRRFFHDASVAPRRSVALQRYAASVLSGIASFRILEGESPELRELELSFLKQTLTRVMSGDDAA